MNSARATNFMTPKSPVEALFRDEVLRLAKDHPFARKLINSGRLSQPCALSGLRLQTGDHPLVGRALIDAPLDGGWLIEAVQGRFVLLALGAFAVETDLEVLRIPAPGPEMTARYGTDCAYLIRPDGHIAAAFDTPDEGAIHAAFARAGGMT